MPSHHMFAMHLLGIDSPRCCSHLNSRCLMHNHMFGSNLDALQTAISDLPFL